MNLYICYDFTIKKLNILTIIGYLVNLFSGSEGASRPRSSPWSSILLTLKPKLLVKGIIFGNFDGVTLGMKVLKLDVAALEALAQMSGLLRGVRYIMWDELTPHGCYHHKVRMFPVLKPEVHELVMENYKCKSQKLVFAFFIVFPLFASGKNWEKWCWLTTNCCFSNLGNWIKAFSWVTPKSTPS